MIWRDLRDEDLISCLNVDPSRIGAELAGYDRAIEAWKHIIGSCSFQSAVIEAEPPVAGRRIVAFGASVFVTRAFADDEISNPRPGLNARIIASVAAGQSVVLSDDQLRRANTDSGLDLVVLYPQWRKGILSVEQISEVKTLLASAFLEAHRGFRLNRFITESLDEVERRSYAEASGTFRTVSDFAGFYAEHPDTIWTTGRSLAVVTREEAFCVPWHIVAILFQYREPVLGLADSDQRLLIAALNGLTDEELAHSLNMPLSAVKKRWRSLFERASAHPHLFPELSDGIFDPGRGWKKRQYILTYVREHPEELRPFHHGDRRRKPIPVRSRSLGWAAESG